MKKALFILFILFTLASNAFAYETTEAMREAYANLGSAPETLFLSDPETEPPYAVGVLTEEARADALDYVNFLRAVVSLPPVAESGIFDDQCAHAALTMALLKTVGHELPKPENMSEEMYEIASIGLRESNLARFNWMRPTLLRDAAAYFARDDGEENLNVLGHRRWLLNPNMGTTGFGLAYDEEGYTYAAMYAVDLSADTYWDFVAWPGGGVFPVELMREPLPWSVSLNPEIYDAEHSEITVRLTEKELGISFSFAASDGTCAVSTDLYGGAPCVIFRPDFEGTDFTEYLQGQVWNAEIGGLRTWDGEARTLLYTVKMVSLYPQEPVNVELSELKLTLKAGEEHMLTAEVIPAYADDTSVTWSSSDESIASVREDGTVTAKKAGSCSIRAESVNGRYDSCELTVE